jgi:hypothetical protein
MIITYLRSSSHGAFEMCPQRFFIEYCLGRRPPSGWKAERGNIVHKALETLARKKLALQQGETKFRDEEMFGGIDLTVDVTPDQALDFSWVHYAEGKVCNGHVWNERDKADCRKWMWDVLLFNGGMFSPLSRKVIAPEQYFDMVIDEPWANYDYLLPDGNRLQGKLSIKGTVDLVTDAGNGVVEYIDWKTGRRWDWAKDKEKTPRKLQDDPQLRLYHYALSQLYPNAKAIIMTIYFIADGGPYTMCFEQRDILKTKQMLREVFETIKGIKRPRLNRSWKCTKFCDFGMKKYEGSNKTICEHFKDELITLGMDRVMQKYAKEGSFSKYGGGGGSANRDG